MPSAAPSSRSPLAVGKQALEFSSRAIEVVGWGLTTLALAFYILADPSSTQAALYAIVPRRFHIRLARIMLNLETIVGGYMRGQIITSVLMALFAYVLLRACGVKNPLPLAVFAGITDVLPLIGGFLGAVPLVAAALPRGTVIAVVVVVAFAAYQEIENRIIIPRVYGHVLRLPAWAITIALLIGAKLMGIVGALLSLPVAAGARMILEELRFELPGDGTVDPELRARDQRVENLYATLAAETGPATSAEIAIEIADSVRKADAAPAGQRSWQRRRTDGAAKAAEVPRAPMAAASRRRDVSISRAESVSTLQLDAPLGSLCTHWRCSHATCARHSARPGLDSGLRCVPRRQCGHSRAGRARDHQRRRALHPGRRVT